MYSITLAHLKETGRALGLTGPEPFDRVSFGEMIQEAYEKASGEKAAADAKKLRVGSYVIDKGTARHLHVEPHRSPIA